MNRVRLAIIGAALTLVNPTVTMMLADDAQAFWDADRASLYGISYAGFGLLA